MSFEYKPTIRARITLAYLRWRGNAALARHFYKRNKDIVEVLRKMHRLLPEDDSDRAEILSVIQAWRNLRIEDEDSAVKIDALVGRIIDLNREEAK